jgi:hypothetical protein
LPYSAISSFTYEHGRKEGRKGDKEGRKKDKEGRMLRRGGC